MGALVNLWILLVKVFAGIARAGEGKTGIKTPEKENLNIFRIIFKLPPDLAWLFNSRGLFLYMRDIGGLLKKVDFGTECAD